MLPIHANLVWAGRGIRFLLQGKFTSRQCLHVAIEHALMRLPGVNVFEDCVLMGQWQSNSYTAHPNEHVATNCKLSASADGTRLFGMHENRMSV